MEGIGPNDDIQVVYHRANDLLIFARSSPEAGEVGRKAAREKYSS